MHADSPPLAPIDRLIAIMARLRDPERGCEWDVAQSFETIAPYTIEEAYEVADAIRRGDMVELKDELGDLLLQVVFHSRIAEEAGLFDIDAVATAIADKMERRHPHIFGDVEHGGHHLWEATKEAERQARGASSALDGVAIALPALKRAAKIQKRAARVGFDWPDAEGPKAKIAEELDEVERAESDDERAAEIGDLLFAVVNYARHHDVEPETALRKATAKFEARFRKMEETTSKPLSDMDLESLETLWQQAKRLV